MTEKMFCALAVFGLFGFMILGWIVMAFASKIPDSKPVVAKPYDDNHFV